MNKIVFSRVPACALLSLAVAPWVAASAFADSARPASALSADNAVLLPENRRILILGDSITQDGRYVSHMEYLLAKAYPGKRYDIVSAGLASETVSGLSEPGHAGGAFPRPDVKKRLERALGAVRPAVVFACYGMNDGIYKGYDESRMEAFRRGVEFLAASCARAGAKLVLVTPPVYDEQRARNRYDSDVLAKFAEWEVKSAPASVARVIDLHTPMRAELDARRAVDAKFLFSPDTIHPNESGHLFMALTILTSLGVKVPAEPREDLLARINADPVWREIHRRRDERSKAWLAHIGYDREKKVAPGTGNIAAAEKLAEERRLAVARQLAGGVKSGN